MPEILNPGNGTPSAAFPLVRNMCWFFRGYYGDPALDAALVRADLDAQHGSQRVVSNLSSQPGERGDYGSVGPGWRRRGNDAPESLSRS